MIHRVHRIAFTRDIFGDAEVDGVAKKDRQRVHYQIARRCKSSPRHYPCTQTRSFSCTWLDHVGGSTLSRDNSGRFLFLSPPARVLPYPFIAHLRPISLSSFYFFLSLRGYPRNCPPQIRTRRCWPPLLHNALARATVRPSRPSSPSSAFATVSPLLRLADFSPPRAFTPARSNTWVVHGGSTDNFRNWPRGGGKM